MNDDARRAILARRAAFLSSALAAMSCSPKQPDAPQVSPTTTVAPVPSEAAPSASASAVPKPEPAAVDVPDLSPPPDAGPELAKKYSRLDEQLAETQRFYDGLEAAIPEGCAPTDASCAEAWQAFAVKVDEERYSMKFHGLWRSACADATPEVKAYHERVGRLREYRFARRTRFEEKFAKTLDAYGEDDKTAFANMVAEARRAKPMPCLSPPPCER